MSIQGCRATCNYFLLSIFSLRCLAQGSAVLFLPWAELCLLAPAETKGGHINHDSLKAQHKKALKLSKVRAFEIYSIRHTFLTRLGESGCDVWTLAPIAGHSQLSMSQRYVHPEEDAVHDMFSRMGGHNIGHSDTPELPEAESDTDASGTKQEG